MEQVGGVARVQLRQVGAELAAAVLLILRQETHAATSKKPLAVAERTVPRPLSWAIDEARSSKAVHFFRGGVDLSSSSMIGTGRAWLGSLGPGEHPSRPSTTSRPRPSAASGRDNVQT